jgi:DNA polymerase III epsilon subunit-like protein
VTTIDAETTPVGTHGLAERTGLWRSEVDRARALGALPEPDTDDGRWSPALVQTIAGQVEQIRDRLAAEEQLGARRCAERLAERTGLPVAAEDITLLAERDLLAARGQYKGLPLYRVGDVDALAEHPDLSTIVADRRAWMAASLDVYEAAARLGWRFEDLATDAAAAGVQPGRFGRFAVADLDRLAGDEAFMAGRLLGPNQAAERLELRRSAFDYVVAAGWLAAARYTQMQVTRRTTSTVALYRAGDIDAVLDVPGVDWEEVRATPPGRPSPLREFIRKPPSRAQIIRRLAADLGNRFQVEVWLFWNGKRWELDWETVDGAPTREQVTAAIAEDPVTVQYRRDLILATEVGAAVNWARAMLEPGAAVILDTETTDLFGAIIEIAVIDAHSGRTLLDTLVDPGCPISAEAQAVHGICDADLTGAPSWRQVLPRLRRATRNRMILAYNADYDQAVVRADTTRAGLKLGQLGEDERWGCVMLRRSDWQRSPRWLRLGGGHRALGDARAARDVLLGMTSPLGRAEAPPLRGA